MGVGLELAILDSAVRLAVDCARKTDLQTCGLFLWLQAKISMCFLNDRATSWQNKQNGLHTQRRRRSAWVSQCAQWISEDPMFLHADSEDSDQTGCKGYIVGFVMRRLMYTLQLSRPATRVSLIANPAVTGSTPTFVEIDHVHFSLTEKGSLQFPLKVCALNTCYYNNWLQG